METKISFITKIQEYFNKIIDLQFRNTISKSKINISSHYDLSNNLFQNFLDSSMTYSSAIWDFTNEKQTLYDAQIKKLNTIIKKAKIQETDNVLEIGTGWGSFAIEVFSGL